MLLFLCRIVANSLETGGGGYFYFCPLERCDTFFVRHNEIGTTFKIILSADKYNILQK